MSAVHSDVGFVGRPGGGSECGCQNACRGGARVFRSVWDLLCQQLFETMPVGMNAADQLPDITVWTEGVALEDDTYPYTFTVVTDGESSPKPSDVVLYKGKYYVIGEVE